jgi:hypothetical protein
MCISKYQYLGRLLELFKAILDKDDAKEKDRLHCK